MALDTFKSILQLDAKYELVNKIADGGMGTVYKARQRHNGELVAIKVLSPHMANNAVLRRRLEQEYNAARTLDHPNIVKALDFSSDDSSPYLVMEFVDGESLGQRIERTGKLGETEAVKIIAQVAQGLYKAHKQGLIHRDVKPDNVLITPDGQAKLTDLGLVKEVDADLNLTRTGRGLGTPHFMSPEQFRNAKKADIRCDIYSLGATLYMMVTGELPFKSCGPVEAWMKKINNDLASPRDLVPNLSERLDWAIRRAMSPDPEKRPASCREFLEDVTGHSTRPNPGPGREGEIELWYLFYRDAEGVTHTVKGQLSGVRRNLKEGQLGPLEHVRVAHTKAGPFEKLKYYPEFRDLVIDPAPTAAVACTPLAPATLRSPITDPALSSLSITPAPIPPPPKVQLSGPVAPIFPPLVQSTEEPNETLQWFLLMSFALLTGVLGYFLVPILSHFRLW